MPTSGPALTAGCATAGGSVVCGCFDPRVFGHAEWCPQGCRQSDGPLGADGAQPMGTASWVRAEIRRLVKGAMDDG